MTKNTEKIRRPRNPVPINGKSKRIPNWEKAYRAELSKKYSKDMIETIIYSEYHR